MLYCIFHSMAVKQNIVALFHSQAGLACFISPPFLPTHTKQPVDTSLQFLSGVGIDVLLSPILCRCVDWKNHHGKKWILNNVRLI